MVTYMYENTVLLRKVGHTTVLPVAPYTGNILRVSLYPNMRPLYMRKEHLRALKLSPAVLPLAFVAKVGLYLLR